MERPSIGGNVKKQKRKNKKRHQKDFKSPVAPCPQRLWDRTAYTIGSCCVIQATFRETSCQRLQRLVRRKASEIPRRKTAASSYCCSSQEHALDSAGVALTGTGYCCDRFSNHNNLFSEHRRRFLPNEIFNRDNSTNGRVDHLKKNPSEKSALFSTARSYLLEVRDVIMSTRNKARRAQAKYWRLLQEVESAMTGIQESLLQTRNLKADSTKVEQRHIETERALREMMVIQLKSVQKVARSTS